MTRWIDYDPIALIILAFGVGAVSLIAFAI
jgi:hypothetical protein